MLGGAMDPHERKGEDKLSKATKDSCKTTIEVIHGLMTQIIKNRLFNQVACQPVPVASSPETAAAAIADVEMEQQ